MAMDHLQVAAVLEEIATLLELKGENPFKTRAYQQGARVIEKLGADFLRMAEEGRLREIPGIGEALAKKLDELVTTGRLEFHQQLRDEFPPDLLALLKISGLGPKRLRAIHTALGVSTLDELRRACEEDRVAALPGMGNKSQAKILEGIQNLQRYSERFLLYEALSEAEEIRSALERHPAVQRISIAGSLRRCKETVKDCDLVVATERPEEVMAAFVGLPQVESVIAHGTTKSSVRLENGLQIDLRCVEPFQFPYVLHHFTGSKEHNVAMRQRALRLGLKMNEYGLFRVGKGEEEVLIECADETELFSALGLDFIPPELREDRGEVTAAEEHCLPALVEPGDLHGAFHVHTVWSDGANTLEEMALAARDLGWDYLGIADHSKSSYWANGLSEERLRRQIEEIQGLNERLAPFRIFTGSEVDILADGVLDYPEDLLKDLDYVVISVHQHFSMPEKEMTARMVRAMEHPAVTMLGHLTGRLLLQREPYALDIDAVLDAAANRGVAIELNANPYRLDMDWRVWNRARALGIGCVINPDAHSTAQLAFTQFGVKLARKGWLQAEDVWNTRGLRDVERLLSKRRTWA